MKKVLFIVAPERFRDEELFVTKAVVEQAGYTSVIASTEVKECPGSRGGRIQAELALREVRVADYAAIIFVGGGGSKLLFDNEYAHNIAQTAAASELVIGAICLAPVIIAKAGLLEGREATVAGTEAETIERYGARYTGPGVTTDGNFVTANGPKSSQAFGEAIIEQLHNQS